jgi:hypothetical protein
MFSRVDGFLVSKLVPSPRHIVIHKVANVTSDSKGAKRVNRQSPFLWSQIKTAATRADKPWKPREILRETQKTDLVSFKWLTEQVINTLSGVGMALICE